MGRIFDWYFPCPAGIFKVLAPNPYDRIWSRATTLHAPATNLTELELDKIKKSTVSCDTSNQILAVVWVITLLFGGLVACHSAPDTQQESVDDLRIQVRHLADQVEQLRKEQTAPVVLLNRYRNSIGYIYGADHVGFDNHHPQMKTRISGTGFLVGNGLLAIRARNKKIHLQPADHGNSRAAFASRGRLDS